MIWSQEIETMERADMERLQT
ncbi:MAG: hypothetical protein JWN15_2501, partial [Firmicutes bacterium]|nr:hypothetical protein [Bacillota bacterium]